MYGIASLDDNWVSFNQGIKYLKYGFGRISDYVNEEIRNGLMSREQGISLLERYDGKFSKKHVDEFCKYLEITKREFWECVDSYVNKSLFQKIRQGEYKRKFKVGIGL